MSVRLPAQHVFLLLWYNYNKTAIEKGSEIMNPHYPGFTYLVQGPQSVLKLTVIIGKSFPIHSGSLSPTYGPKLWF